MNKYNPYAEADVHTYGYGKNDVTRARNGCFVYIGYPSGEKPLACWANYSFSEYTMRNKKYQISFNSNVEDLPVRNVVNKSTGKTGVKVSMWDSLDEKGITSIDSYLILIGDSRDELEMAGIFRTIQRDQISSFEDMVKENRKVTTTAENEHTDFFSDLMTNK